MSAHVTKMNHKSLLRNYFDEHGAGSRGAPVTRAYASWPNSPMHSHAQYNFYVIVVQLVGSRKYYLRLPGPAAANRPCPASCLFKSRGNRQISSYWFMVVDLQSFWCVISCMSAIFSVQLRQSISTTDTSECSSTPTTQMQSRWCSFQTMDGNWNLLKNMKN